MSAIGLRAQRRASWTDAHWAVVDPGDAVGDGPNATPIPRRDRLSWPLLARGGRRILVGGQADLFDDHVPLEFVASVFGVMALAPQHTFQVLTRFPHRLQFFMEWLDHQRGWLPMRLCQVGLCKEALQRSGVDLSQFAAQYGQPAWPLRNVWCGFRARNAAELRNGLPQSLLVPAALRWLLLERPDQQVDLTQVQCRGRDGPESGFTHEPIVQQALNALTGCVRHGSGAIVTTVARLDWVVIDGRRTAVDEVARTVAEQCLRAKVPLYCSSGRLDRELPRELPRVPPMNSWLERRHATEARGPVRQPASVRSQQLSAAAV
jgi:protein gp37